MLKRVKVVQLGWCFQVVLVLSFLRGPAFAQQPKDSFHENQNTVQVLINQAYPSLEKLYTYFHSHPELSFHEKETSARLAGELKTIGFDVVTHIGGYGVVGILKNGNGPTVMIRTDMDALPITEETGLPYASRIRTKNEQGHDVGVTHACGHDMHMTVFVGTAYVLMQMRDRWSGTLVMVGQPAEEKGAGAKAMLAEGLFTRFPIPDYCLALHVAADLPARKVGYRSGYAMANVDSVDITVHGVGGHGASPHKTKDPTPSLYNEPILTERLVKTFENALGKENVVSRDPEMIGEDFSRYGRTKENVPICMFRLGAIGQNQWEEKSLHGKEPPSLHSNMFAPVVEATIKTGVKAMATATLELLESNPE